MTTQFPRQSPLSPTPKELQDLLLNFKPGQHDLINVQLNLTDTENYNEQLPSPVVLAMIDPTVPDFFILVHGTGRKLAREKRRYLHTSFIRELILLDDLPEPGGKKQ